MIGSWSAASYASRAVALREAAFGGEWNEWNGSPQASYMPLGNWRAKSASNELASVLLAATSAGMSSLESKRPHTRPACTDTSKVADAAECSLLVKLPAERRNAAAAPVFALVSHAATALLN